MDEALLLVRPGQGGRQPARLTVLFLTRTCEHPHAGRGRRLDPTQADRPHLGTVRQGGIQLPVNSRVAGGGLGEPALPPVGAAQPIGRLGAELDQHCPLGPGEELVQDPGDVGGRQAPGRRPW